MYLLFSKDLKVFQISLYIGEADEVNKRINDGYRLLPGSYIEILGCKKWTLPTGRDKSDNRFNFRWKQIIGNKSQCEYKLENPAQTCYPIRIYPAIPIVEIICRANVYVEKK